MVTGVCETLFNDVTHVTMQPSFNRHIQPVPFERSSLAEGKL